MKNSLLLIILLLTLSCCNKDDDNTPDNPVSQLPPKTQTGANTFGCLLDGQAFLPSGGTNPLDCVYQFVNGGYYFSLQGSRDQDFIGLATDDLEIQQGQVYQLYENIALNAYGVYAFEAIFSYTTNTYTGELTITKLDTINQIVSGTFWFDVEHPISGEIVEIREGRFDMQYTQ